MGEQGRTRGALAQIVWESARGQGQTALGQYAPVGEICSDPVHGSAACPGGRYVGMLLYYISMGSLHIDAAIRTAQKWDADPRTSRIIPDCMDGIRTGRWDRDYLDAVGQLSWGGPSKWLPHEVAAFAVMHRNLMIGLISQVEIEVGAVPFPDAERQANASALEDLPNPFSSYVDRTQRNDGQDGWLKWTQPITVIRSVGVAHFMYGAEDPRPVTMRPTIPPGGVPLEIGTTLPSRTALHVFSDRGVARWPYESTRIRLFVSSKFPRPLVQAIH